MDHGHCSQGDKSAPVLLPGRLFFSIPIFAFLYMFFAAHDFYAPYAKYEPGANQDRVHLAKAILAALRQLHCESRSEICGGQLGTSQGFAVSNQKGESEIFLALNTRHLRREKFG
jgi:hypothetical protein